MNNLSLLSLLSVLVLSHQVAATPIVDERERKEETETAIRPKTLFLRTGASASSSVQLDSAYHSENERAVEMEIETEDHQDWVMIPDLADGAVYQSHGEYEIEEDESESESEDYEEEDEEKSYDDEEEEESESYDDEEEESYDDESYDEDEEYYEDEDELPTQTQRGLKSAKGYRGYGYGYGYGGVRGYAGARGGYGYGYQPNNIYNRGYRFNNFRAAPVPKRKGYGGYGKGGGRKGVVPPRPRPKQIVRQSPSLVYVGTNNVAPGLGPIVIVQRPTTEDETTEETTDTGGVTVTTVDPADETEAPTLSPTDAPTVTPEEGGEGE